MITLSEFSMLGVVEVIAVFLFGSGALLFNNQRLRKRIHKLSGQLKALKDTTRELLARSNATYRDHLARELQETKDHLSDENDADSPRLDQCDDDSTKAAALRHAFLTSELAAELSSDEDSKWKTLIQQFGSIFEEMDKLNKGSDPTESEGDVAQLKDRWVYLCEAAATAVTSKTNITDKDLFQILEKINAELGFDPLVLPDLDDSESSIEGPPQQVVSWKQGSADQKSLIESLLKGKEAAEQEVSIKAEELVRLQRFLEESDVCMQLLEDELSHARQQMDSLEKLASEVPEMKEIISNFARDSTEMLSCIETLEKENAELRRHSGLEPR